MPKCSDAPTVTNFIDLFDVLIIQGGRRLKNLINSKWNSNPNVGEASGMKMVDIEMYPSAKFQSARFLDFRE
jgi:hypothetical protein